MEPAAVTGEADVFYRTKSAAPAARSAPRPPSRRSALPAAAALAVTLAVLAGSAYANLSFLVTDSASYRYFPPFEKYVNANHNKHLGAEYFSIARALVAGRGFADPFYQQTDAFEGPPAPTAWMPPVLPVILAGLLVLTGGSTELVMTAVIQLQNLTLILTGLLVLALARQTTARVGVGLAAAAFVFALLYNFRLCFQFTHDCWLVLLVVNGLVAGLCWGRPLAGHPRAALWGAFGGLCALTSPVVGLTWGVLTAWTGWRERLWSRLAVAALCAALTVAPWVVRNYLLFGRWMPVKSNAMYELYQSQCLQPDGLLKAGTFGTHPWSRPNRARQEYKDLCREHGARGEVVFIDRKAALFWEAVRANPVDFLDRVACRFLGATLWYVPFDRASAVRRPVWTWAGRLIHPLPFLAAVVLAYSAFWKPLHWSQWAVIGVYALYLAPYVAVSYYERYALPLLGVKVLLVVWAADRLLTLALGEKSQAPLSRPARPASVAPKGAEP